MENFNGCYEFDNRLEQIENFGSDKYEFDVNQMAYIEDVLASEGYTLPGELNCTNIEEVVSSIDRRIESLHPELPTKANYTHFGLESDVWAEFRSMLEPKYLEAPVDKIQHEQIADAMVEMKELRFENWSTLTLDEQVKVLSTLEHKIAAIAHRPAAEIRSEEMEDGVFGYQSEGSIAINSDLIEQSSRDPELFDQMLETLIHEGRHQYQDYNVNERLVHQSKAQVESWRENMNLLGYAEGDPVKISLLGIPYTDEGLSAIGARLYYYQPVEIDSRNFASDTMTEFHNRLNA